MDNSEALFDLISNIQSKLDEKNLKENNTPTEIHTTNNTTTTNNETNFNLNDIINNLTSSTENKTNEESNFDINNILKFQKILSSFNSEDPRKKLLLSLKPFLRESRQNKINEYITYLTIIKTLGIFDNKEE